MLEAISVMFELKFADESLVRCCVPEKYAGASRFGIVSSNGKEFR